MKCSSLEQLLSENDAQLLHIYFGHIAVHLLPLMRHWPKPSVVSFHGADVMVDLDKPRYRAATKEMLAAARLVLVRSQSLARAVDALGCPVEKIRMHRTGIPLGGNRSFQARVWPNDGAWRLLQAGRLIEKKGFQTSLRAFAAFQRAESRRALHDRRRRTAAGASCKLWRANLAWPIGFDSSAFSRRRNCASSSIGRTFFCIRASAARTEIRKAFRTRCSKRWPADCRSSRPATAEFRKRSSTERAAFWSDERDHAALAEALLDWTRRPEALAQLARPARSAVAEKFEQRAQARELENFYFEALERGP